MSDRVQRKIEKKKRRFLVGFGIFLLCTTLLSLYWYAASSPYFKIKHIEITEQEFSSLVYDIIQGTLEESTGLPRDSILSFPYIGSKNILREKLPEIANLSILPSGINTLAISFTLRTPVLRYEREVIDENFTRYTDRRYFDVPTLVKGYEGLTQTTFTNLLETVKKISVRLGPIDTVEVNEYQDVFLTSREYDTILMYNLTSNPEDVWILFLSAIDQEPLRSSLETKKEVAYIDLRFGNKAYYKLREK